MTTPTLQERLREHGNKMNRGCKGVSNERCSSVEGNTMIEAADALDARDKEIERLKNPVATQTTKAKIIFNKLKDS